MARCPDCQKFVPNGELEFPDGAEVNIEGTQITVAVRAVIPCASCGTELSDYDFSVTEEICDLDHAADCPTLIEESDDSDEEDEEEDKPEHQDEEYEVNDEGDPEAIDEFRTMDRHGKPIKNSRYQKHEYGFSQTVTVSCSHCGAEKGIEFTDKTSASSFNSLV